MPIYEYACQDCDAEHEALRPMKDADVPIACPKCGSKKSKRLHSVVGAIVGGSSSESSRALPMGAPGGCGRCGDPNGACPYK